MDIDVYEARAAGGGTRRAVRALGCLALAFAIELLALGGTANAEASRCPPYPCYHTAQGVLDWKPSMVRPYDVAGVPLARTAGSSRPGMLIGVDDGPWAYWDQGDLNAQGSDARGNIYKLVEWPYVDRLYYYSHNLLSVPPTVWTNAAHRQGVKVLATLTGDCDNLACEDEMDLLFAQHPHETVDQLRRIAAAYGFDGWMIDIEEGSSLTPNLLAAMSDLSKRRLPNGARVEVLFYNAYETSIDSRIYSALKAAGHWQSDYSPQGAGAVTDPRRSYAFLKRHGATDRAEDAYWSTYVYNYQTDAGHCNGRSSADFLWNGNDCLDRATLFANQGSAVPPRKPPGRYQAPSLYAPAWTLFGGLNDTTAKLPRRRKFERTDAALWRGPGFVDHHGRCVPANRSANAVSSMVRVRPTIARVPFVTRFDSGEGSSFSVQGTVVRENSWNLLSAQDPLPVAWCGDGNTLDAALDYGTAFDGGSSLRVSGKARNGSRRVYLYKADIALPANTGFLLRYAADSRVRPHVVISVSGIHGPVDLRTRPTGRHRGWLRARARLPGRLEHATLTRVGVGFKRGGARPARVDANIGELRVVDRGRLARPEEIRPTRRGGELSWKAAPGPMLYYEVWARDPRRRCLQFLGRTQIERYDLAKPLFRSAPAAGGFEVEPVSAAGGSARLSDPRCRLGS
jgi:hypothetical protein